MLLKKVVSCFSMIMCTQSWMKLMNPQAGRSIDLISEPTAILSDGKKDLEAAPEIELRALPHLKGRINC